MDIDRVQRGLTGWLHALAGDPAIIENEPRPALIRRTGFWIVSPPNSITPYGTDTVTYADGIATVVGRRGFMCVIKYVCRDQAATRNARFWLEQARMSLYRPLVQEHFREYGMGLVRMAPTVTYDSPYQNRVESIAAAELHLTCAVVDTLGAEDIGYIEDVEISGEFPDSSSGLEFTDTIDSTP